MVKRANTDRSIDGEIEYDVHRLRRIKSCRVRFLHAAHLLQDLRDRTFNKATRNLGHRALNEFKRQCLR